MIRARSLPPPLPSAVRVVPHPSSQILPAVNQKLAPSALDLEHAHDLPSRFDDNLIR